MRLDMEISYLTYLYYSNFEPSCEGEESVRSGMLKRRNILQDSCQKMFKNDFLNLKQQ